jgi:hypothetical protein
MGKLHHALILLILAALAPACGGGGGGGSGGGGGAGKLSGDYHRVVFTGLNTTNSGVVGTSIFLNGTDYMEATVTNTNGVIDSFVDAGTFSVVAGGAFAWTDATPVSFSGGVRPGGSFAISGSVTNGANPAVIIDVRKGPCTDATFSGTYYVVGYGAGASNYSFTGLLTADGANSWSISATTNQNGTISGGVTNSGVYFVEEDGTVTMIDLAGQVLTGGLLAGGDILVTSATSSGGPSEITVAVKKGGSFSNSSMSGAYRGISFGSAPGVAASHFSLVKNANFSGAGVLTWTATQNLEGTLGAVPLQTEAYSIAADGTFTITGGLTFSGGVLAGGSVAVASAVTAAGYMEIRVYVRSG